MAAVPRAALNQFSFTLQIFFISRAMNACDFNFSLMGTGNMKRNRRVILLGILAFGIVGTAASRAQMSDKYQPNAESKKYPEGSALERKARMAEIANNPAYTRK